MNRSNRGPDALAVLALLALALSPHPHRAAFAYQSTPGAGREIEVSSKKYEADPESITARQNERIKLAMSRSDLGPFGLAVVAMMALAQSDHPRRADFTSESSSRPGVNADVREIEVTAQKYEFDPDKITVRQNERIELVITALDHDHGFKIDAYHIDQLLKKGEQTTIEFTADTPGTFPFECSHFCGLGHKGMKGELIVESASQRTPEDSPDPHAEQASSR